VPETARATAAAGACSIREGPRFAGGSKKATEGDVMRVRGLRVFGCAALAACWVSLAAADAGAAGVNGREAYQRQRIGAGVQDGSLTRGEAHALRHEQRHIERVEQRMRADDGVLGPRERLRLDDKLDRSSRHIYRARHNERTRE
jgi:hypothetical protein